LLYSGFVLHGTLPLLSFGTAHEIHIAAGIALLVLTAFAIFWHATTGEWRQYVPTTAGLPMVVRHYLLGIFRGEPHPYRKVPEAKLNPLQRLAYLFLKLLLLPLLLVTGALLYGHPWLKAQGWAVPFGDTAVMHTAGAFAMLAFLIIHAYLTTTGGTVWSYTKAMITGWEEVDH
jgi:thiosulfate reductase cytochrome b subunit